MRFRVHHRTEAIYTSVSDSDAAAVRSHAWYVSEPRGLQKRRYVFTVLALPGGRKRTVMLHRFVLGLEFGDTRLVDHKNGDTLDNRRANLRVCTYSQSNMNRTRLKRKYRELPHGVVYARKKYAALIAYGGRQYHLGTFETVEAAQQAYSDAAAKHHREFASRSAASPTTHTPSV